jgi:hypothetical protein
MLASFLPQKCTRNIDMNIILSKLDESHCAEMLPQDLFDFFCGFRQS